MKKNIIAKCKTLLNNKKEELLQQNNVFANKLKNTETKGDEIDVSNSLLAQHKQMALQTRSKLLLIEIETALEKIKNNEYGICEYTGLSISEARLLALPWTRLCIEGAETVAQIRKKFKQTIPT